MSLHLLRHTTCLRAYYDLRHDWLYLDWEGELTLPAVQQACLALAACYLQRPYARILNNNQHVTGISWSVAAWLATDFLPHMTLAGIEHVAWIYSPSLRGHHLVQTVLNWLPGSLISTFHEVADAEVWLHQTRTAAQRGYLLPTRPAATQAQLAQVIQALHQRVAQQQATPKRAAWRRIA